MSRVLMCMITVGVIRNGSTYLSHHLRKNDYWTEGEKEVRGEWIGQGATALGLTGMVTDEPFEALRQNRHPSTGEPLTARDHANRVAFFDVQLSAPKDVSALAIVGGDDRVRGAFIESVKTALGEMERFAAVREGRGEAAGTEAYRLTANFVGALFIHDASAISIRSCTDMRCWQTPRGMQPGTSGSRCSPPRCCGLPRICGRCCIVNWRGGCARWAMSRTR